MSNTNAENAKMRTDWATYVMVVLLAAFSIFLASGGDAFAGLKEAVDKIYGPAYDVRTVLSALAVFALGVGAVFGRISVTQALVVATGIIIVTKHVDIADGIRTSAGITATFDKAKDEADAIKTPLAVIAVIGAGIGAMFGRMTWTQALTLAVGVVILTDYSGIASTLR